MENIEYTLTHGMDEATVAARLGEQGTGVLALSRDGDAYAFPVAYYRDGDSLFFRLGEASDSEKREYLDATEQATLVVYEADPTPEARELDSWSILARGRLRAVPADDPAYNPAEINDQFSPIRVFDEPIDEMAVTLYELQIASITGRETPA
jgi:nitroimidazol reductase NimA-like FMN-containing flavoprotein (pyridoxamine 5'-phosphate oxidase superfamily)